MITKPLLIVPKTLFVNVGSDLASNILQAQKLFETYLNLTDTVFHDVPLSEDEIKTAFFSLKCGKSSGYDDMSYDIVKQKKNTKKPFLLTRLKRICKLPFKQGIFPDKLKTAKVTPIFKSGDTSHLSNYRPSSFVPCFSKILK